jgi:hypothetical protein
MKLELEPHEVTIILKGLDKLPRVEIGAKYSDPVDLVPCRYTYVETEEPIEALDNEVAFDE